MIICLPDRLPLIGPFGNSDREEGFMAREVFPWWSKRYVSAVRSLDFGLVFKTSAAIFRDMSIELSFNWITCA